MAEEFAYPDFIKDNDPETIHERMMRNLPVDISAMPGDFAYDFTMPVALEKSELIQFHVVRTLMLMFPQYAWGEYLDLHGIQAGVIRKPAGYAYGKLMISGIPGTRIEKGKIFCTAATDDSPSVEFALAESVEIPEEGDVIAEIAAVESGCTSNVAPNTVVLVQNPDKNIFGVTNPDAITGGTDVESDELYCERILESYRKEISFVGNDADYIRWAKEVVGVGVASVIPEWDGPGTVKLILVDANGQPASEFIRKSVYDYIMSPENRIQRKAPIGAVLTVSSPELVPVSITATVELKEGYSIDQVKIEYEEKLQRYYNIALSEGEIKYTKVCAVLSETDGINDFSGLLMNESTRNVRLQKYEFPVIVAVDLVSGVVT